MPRHVSSLVVLKAILTAVGGNLRLYSPLPLRVTSGGRPSLICDCRYAEMNCESPFLTRVSQ